MFMNFRNLMENEQSNVLESLKKTNELFLVLNDIIKNINRAMSIQIIILVFQYLITGIFSIFGTIEASLENGNAFKSISKWYRYFSIAEHILVALTCAISSLIQNEARIMCF